MPTGKPNKKYSGEFKEKVIETMQKEKLSYREAARQFEITDNKIVTRWERIYLEEGTKGLYVERRGRASAASGTQKGRKPKFDKQTEENLIEEVQRLRAENAYLKNLQALVLEDERHLHKKHR